MAFLMRDWWNMKNALLGRSGSSTAVGVRSTGGGEIERAVEEAIEDVLVLRVGIIGRTSVARE